VRSRVVCSKCNKPSDTFDHFLDLSLDCGPAKKSITDMLAGFIKNDKLEGDNKYHCER
jgi:ubiquitin carboxyl-terminal hydrolase 36/42